MQKNLAESKRSIHSTRIDVIAGDPMPIVPRSTLPINSIDRPVVEDPEYLPDTVPDLAACLSALARAVPAESVREVYRTVRDIIDRIAPITRTSLDFVDSLHEGLQDDDDPEDPMTGVRHEAQAIATALQSKMKHYRSLGTAFATDKADELKRFSDSFYNAFNYLTILDRRLTSGKSKKLDRDREELVRLRAGALSKLLKLEKQYRMNIRDAKTAFETSSGDASPATKALVKQNILMSLANRLEIFNAFEHRIRELLASGDSFDFSIAEAVRARSASVYPLIGFSSQAATRPSSDEGVSDEQRKRLLFPKYTQAEGDFPFTEDLYKEITENLGDLSQFRLELIGGVSRVGDSRVQIINSIHIDPLFSPGRIRVEVVPVGDAVRYDIDDPSIGEITSFGYVTVYRRFLQMFDGTDVEIRPDVRIDFDEIKADFIDNAAEDLRRQNEPHPEDVAERFYEQNKKYIIREALDPQKGAGKYMYDESDVRAEEEEEGKTRSRKRKPKFRDEKGRIREFMRSNTPERGALLVANSRLEELEAANQAGYDTSEGALYSQALKLAASLIAKGANYESVYRTIALADEFREIKQDEIHRLISSAVRANRRKGQLNEVELRDLQRAVKTYFKQSAFVLSDSSPVPSGEAVKAYLKLQEDAKKSFSIVSEGNVEKMRQRGIKAAQEMQDVMPDETANQAISQSLARAKSASSQVVRLGDTTYMTNLVAVLRRSIGEIAEDQAKSIDRAVDALQLDNPDLAYSESLQSILDKRAEIVTHMEKLAADVRNFGTQNQTDAKTASGVIRRSARRAGTRDLSTLDGIASEVAAIARMTSDSTPFNVKFGEMINGTLQDQLSDVIAGAIEQFIAEDSDPKKYAMLASGEINIADVVGRIGADLSSLPEAKSQGSAALSKLLLAGFRQYGVSESPFFMPIFAEDELLEKIKAEASSSNRKVLPYKIADTLFGSVGIGESIGAIAERLSPEAAVANMTGTVDAIASVSIPRAISSFAQGSSLGKIVRSLVNITCRALVISAGASEAQQAEFVHVNEYLDALSDMIEVGSRSPSMLLAPLSKKIRGIQRAVSVDLKERGVGFYVDTSGNHVARAVASPDVHNLANFVGKSGELRIPIDFLDPELGELFDGHEDAVTRLIAANLNAAPGSEAHNAIRAHVREELINALKDAAAEINIGIVQSQNFRPPKSAMALTTFRDLQEKIMKGSTSSRFAKAIAAAAFNYTVINGRVPGEFIHYFTPLQSTERVDPDTGMRTLKGGTNFDFLFKTFPIAAAEPRIDDAPTSLTDDFLNKVYRLVDMHILTDVSDGLGETIKKLYDPDDKQKDRFRKSLFMQPAVSTETQFARKPRTVMESQILTVYDVIRPGITYEELTRLREEAKNFVMQMLIRSHGYTMIGASGKPPNFVSVKISPKEHLTPVAFEILDLVDNHILLRAKAVGVNYYARSVRDSEGNEQAVALSASEISDIAEKRARAAILQKIGEEHPDAIGLSSPLSIRADQTTGLPDFPASPTDFIRQKMPDYGGPARFTDPAGYLLRLNRATKEYRQLLDSYGAPSVARQEGGSVGKLLENLSENFPAVLNRARAISQKKMAGKTPPVIDLAPMISFNVKTGVMSGCSNPPRPSETKNLLDKLVETYENFKTATVNSQFVEMHSAQINKFLSSLAVLEKIQDVFETSQRPTAAFPDRYVDCSSTLNDVIRSVVAAETKKLEEDVDTIFLPDVRIACEEELERASQTKQEDAEDSQRIKDLKDIILQLKRIMGVDEESLKRIRSEKVSFKIPTLDSVTSEAINNITDERNKLVKQLTKVRKRANVVADRAVEALDQDLTALARKMLRVVTGKTGVQINLSNLMIVNTVEDLETLREQLLNERSMEILEKLSEEAREDLSDESTSRINEAAKDYVNAALSHMIFGVRNAKKP